MVMEGRADFRAVLRPARRGGAVRTPAAAPRSCQRDRGGGRWQEDGRVWAAQADRYGGRSLEDVLHRRQSVARFLLDVADEARALACMEDQC